MSTNITTTTGVSASGSSRLHFGNNTNNYYYGNDSCNVEASSQSQQRTVSSTPSNENGLKLMRAAKAGQLPRVKYLIKMGANICYHCDEDSTTPLHQAVLSGHEAVIEALLEAGANMDAEDNTGATPLHLASHKDIVRLLINAGADVDHEDYAGRTPGRRALELDKMDVVSALINGNANRSKLYRTTKNTGGKAASSSATRGQVSLHRFANVVDGSPYDRLIIGIATDGAWFEVAYALINDQTHIAWQTVQLQQIANNFVTDHQGHRTFSVSDIEGVDLDSFLSLPAGRPDPKLSYLMECLCKSPEDALFKFLKGIDEPLLRAISSRHPEIFIDIVEKDYIVSISEPSYEESKAIGMKRSSDGGPLGVAWITELEACLQYAMPYNDDGQLEVGDFVVTCRNSRNIWAQNVAFCAVYHVITLTPFRLRQLKQTQKCCEERIRKNWSIANVLTPRESIGPHMIQSESNKAWIAILRRFISTQSSWTRQANKAIVLLGGFTGGWANEAIAGIQEDHPQAQIVKHLLRNGPGGNLWKAARGAVALGVARQSQQNQAKNVEC